MSAIVESHDVSTIEAQREAKRTNWDYYVVPNPFGDGTNAFVSQQSLIGFLGKADCEKVSVHQREEPTGDTFFIVSNV